MKTTKQGAERRFAQIEGERDYYKRQAERRGAERDQLREALKEIADLPSFMHDEAEVIARAALKATEGE